MNLLSVAEAQARLLSLAAPLPSETLPLELCAGRWLAEDVIARRDQPWADLSAMDGYAISAEDLAGPWTLAGESAAGGDLPPPLRAGQTARIFTGAPLPQGSDMIVLQEDVERDGDTISLAPGVIAKAKAHVRLMGSDFREGATLLSSGTRLGAAQIALAAVGGYGLLRVGRRPRIAIVSTGSELVAAGDHIPPGKLPSSNALMLRTLLSTLPCEVEDMGIVPDTLSFLTDTFSRATQADLIVSTGGASVGDHDLIRPALEAAGGNLDFWKVAIRPGKPLIVGTLGNAVMLGLPGNPVSAFATANLFLLPIVRKLAGSLAPIPAPVAAQLGAAVGEGGQRAEYLRAKLEGGVATPLDNQDSAALVALASANAFILRPAGAPAGTVGETVSVFPFVDLF
jgi:molybdopterin molybdotransferase